MDGAEKPCRSRKGANLSEELVVAPGATLGDLGHLAAQQPGNELIATHADETVDGVHGGPLPHIGEGP